MNKISVIVVTRNRPGKLKNLLKSLSTNTVKFEALIIDQSDDFHSAKNIEEAHKYRFAVYKRQKTLGKSRGLNLGISLASSPILCFTDDDCVVAAGWLKNILERFSTSKKTSGVFGRTLPYKPQLHKGFSCPSTFSKKNSGEIIRPGKHWRHIGFGNNMAFRKEVFDYLGGFKEWLGPGSIGSNAEDAEMSLRTLIANKRLYYDSSVVLYHDRFLDEEEIKKQTLSYICGEMACYGYFAANGHAFAKKVVDDDFKLIKKDLIRLYDHLAHFRFFKLPDMSWILSTVKARMRGYIIARIMVIMEPGLRGSTTIRKTLS